MGDRNSLSRRDFLKVCGTALAGFAYQPFSGAIPDADENPSRAWTGDS